MKAARSPAETDHFAQDVGGDLDILGGGFQPMS
jgi:hypothetical protein